MVKNVIQNKYGIMTAADVNVRKHLKNVYVKKIMNGMPKYVLASVIKNVKLIKYLNSSTCTKQFVENLVITCEDKMVNAIININSTKSLYQFFFFFFLYKKFYISYI